MVVGSNPVQAFFFFFRYASYIKHQDIRVVFSQTENAVWEDVHPNSRDFVKKYLQQVSYRKVVGSNPAQVF